MGWLVPMARGCLGARERQGYVMTSCHVTFRVLAVFAFLITACRPTPEPRATPLVHSAYIWKQGWNASSAAGLAPEVIPAAISELNVLVGECGLSGGSRSVAVPWAAVKASGRSIAVSVRIGAHRTLTSSTFDNLDEGLRLARRGIEQAKTAGVKVREVQIDFDCPTRLLADYATWIRGAKDRIEVERLTVTTLPTWLSSRDFEKLVAAADGWTLQVHGTDRADLNNPKLLIEGEQAIEWIRKANRLGRPYRVALPTYSYLACFNTKGRYLGMRAEGVGLPEGTAQCLHLPAEPEEVAKVLKFLEDGRQGLVQAIDWYRLPLPGDAQIWTTQGLGEVIAGRPMAKNFTFEMRRQGALVDILLENPTEQPLPIPSVKVIWRGATLVGADATMSWEVHSSAGDVTFKRNPVAGFLPPKGSKVVGWVRLNEEVALEVGVGK